LKLLSPRVGVFFSRTRTLVEALSPAAILCEALAGSGPGAWGAGQDWQRMIQEGPDRPAGIMLASDRDSGAVRPPLTE